MQWICTILATHCLNVIEQDSCNGLSTSILCPQNLHWRLWQTDVTLYSLMDRYQHWRLWLWNVTLYSLVDRYQHWRLWQCSVTLYSLVDMYQHWRLWLWDVTLYSLVDRCKHLVCCHFWGSKVSSAGRDGMDMGKGLCLGFTFRPLAFPDLYSWYCMHLIALCTALWVLFHIRDSPPGNVCHLVYLLLSTCTAPIFLYRLDSSCLGPPSLFLSPCLFLFRLFVWIFSVPWRLSSLWMI
jgi:hypothetical protein